MSTLVTRIPDVEVLLALAPEELGLVLLQLVTEHMSGNGLIHNQRIVSQMNATGVTPGYPDNRKNEAELAILESWNWLTVQGLLIPAPGINGNNGHMCLSRKAKRLVDETAYRAYADSVAFPKTLIHPSIAEEVWLDLARSDLSTAVFKSIRAVEIAVRDACNYGADEYGVTMMRKAFNRQDGPLTDQNHPESERQALSDLFVGVIGSYKNPHSHRTVEIADPREAQEMVVLASHLLRIVDSRRYLVSPPVAAAS